MECQREGHRKLRSDLHSHRQGAKTGTVELPAEERGDEVRGAEAVEGARDAVEGGGEVVDLRAVDGEVWGYRAVPALGDEELVRCWGLDGLRYCARHDFHGVRGESGGREFGEESRAYLICWMPAMVGAGQASVLDAS